MAEKIRLRATYNPDLDTLYLNTPSCTGKWMDSGDSLFFFFTVYNERGDTVPGGFEIHHFTDVWNDDQIIPSLDLRFDVEASDIQDATLAEVLQWAYEKFVAKRKRKEHLDYLVPAAQLHAAIRERGENG
jgi:hypothetical protein